jgi:hypothetical protein
MTDWRSGKRRALIPADLETVGFLAPVDRPLDIEQLVDPLHCFKRQWRDCRRLAAPPRIGRDVRQFEELPAGMGAQSDATRPVIPIQSGHGFRFNPATGSEAKRPVRFAA